MSSYYQLLSRTNTDNKIIARYQPNQEAQGAWNPHEQHMAPASGVMTHEIERFMPREDMQLGRLSFDIFGLISLTEFTVTTELIRAGRSIELIEATLEAEGKICIVARAWRMQTSDTSSVAGLEDNKAEFQPADLPNWEGMLPWGGGYINSLTAKCAPNHRSGKGLVWFTNDINMVEGEEKFPLTHFIGMVDTANGTAPRLELPPQWAFPNLDLQVHFYRIPQGKWLGIEAQQQYGTNGIGLTSSILHDELGPFGRCEQILTLRKL